MARNKKVTKENASFSKDKTRDRSGWKAQRDQARKHKGKRRFAEQGE